MNTIRMIVFIAAILILPIQLVANGTLTPNASFLGMHYKERVGYVIDCAGDMNGDGYDDIIIGTFHNHTKGWDAGAVYLILGRKDVSYWGMQDSLSHSDARFIASQRLEAVGFSIAGNGDVNGDGLSDIVIGAPAGNDLVGSRPGKMYVVFGDSTVPWGYDCILDDRADVIYHGENPQDLAGRTVEIIKDINDDGCDEILCAAPYNDYAGTDAGKVYLIMGRRDGWNSNAKLPMVSIASFVYNKAYATTGYSVADVGDVNNDGTTDFAFGANSANRVFVVFGKTGPNWGDHFSLDNADLIIEPEFRYRNIELGWAVEGVHDVNGDGVDDFIISAIEDNSGGYQAGKVYLVFGRNGGWDNKVFNLTLAGASFIGENSGDQAGWGIGGAGDINKDGYSEILIGAWKNYCQYPEAGKMYLIYGKPSGWELGTDLETIPDYFSGIADTNFAGYAVSTAGDFDNDGWTDFFTSAPYNDGTSIWSGQIYMFASQKHTFTVQGNVNYYDSAEPVQNVWLTVTGSQANADTVTDMQGQYFLNVQWKNSYTLTASKQFNEDVSADYISVYDAVLAVRHSIRLDTLNSFRARVADVNEDGRVSAYDASLIMRYSLGYPTIDGSQVGKWLFSPDSILIDQLNDNIDGQNFSAIILGDVNADWGMEDSNLGKQQSIVFQPYLGEENNLTLPIHFENEKNILSFDIQLEYDAEKLTFQQIRKSAALACVTLDYYSPQAGILNIGAYSAQPVDIEDNTLDIVFKSIYEPETGDIKINRFRINDSALTATINSMNVNRIKKFQLSQNYPNPFNGITAIPYQVEKPGQIEFRIYNTLGQLVYKLTEEKTIAGNYQFSWDGRNLDREFVTTGVYLCQAKWGSVKYQIKLLYIK